MAAKVPEGPRPEFFTEINLLRGMVDKIDAKGKKEDLVRSLTDLEKRVDAIQKMQWQVQEQKQSIISFNGFLLFRKMVIQAKISAEKGLQDDTISQLKNLKGNVFFKNQLDKNAINQLRNKVLEIAEELSQVLSHGNASPERIQAGLEELRTLITKRVVSNIDFDSSFLKKILSMEPAVVQVFVEFGYDFVNVCGAKMVSGELLNALAHSMPEGFEDNREMVLNLIKHFHSKGLSFIHFVGARTLIHYTWLEYLSLDPVEGERFLDLFLRAIDDVELLNIADKGLGLSFLGNAVMSRDEVDRDEAMAFIKKLVFWGATITDAMLVHAVPDEAERNDIKAYLEQCAAIRQRAIRQEIAHQTQLTKIQDATGFPNDVAFLTIEFLINPSPSAIYDRCLQIDEEQQKKAAQGIQGGQQQPAAAAAAAAAVDKALNSVETVTPKE